MVLDGVWRLTVSEEELRAAGVPRESASYNDGTWTFTIQSGAVKAEQNSPKNLCRARIAIRTNKLSWKWDRSTGCNGDFRGTFTRKGDVVRITSVTANGNGVTFYSLFFRHGLHRIGNAP